MMNLHNTYNKYLRIDIYAGLKQEYNGIYSWESWCIFQIIAVYWYTGLESVNYLVLVKYFKKECLNNCRLSMLILLPSWGVNLDIS